MNRWIGMILLTATGLVACTYTDNTNSCNAGNVTLQLAALSSLVTPVTTTTVMVSSKTGSDAGPTTTTTVMESVQNPAQVFVNMAVVATFSCHVQGDAHGSLLASVGQFTNGLATASSSGGAGAKDGGGSSSPGTSTTGVSGASVNVLLTSVSAGTSSADAGLARLALDAGSGTVLAGYATLQMPSGRTSQLQAVVGDTSVCWNLVTGGVVDAGAGLVDGGTVQMVPSQCQ